jgi:hypothetical protein
VLGVALPMLVIYVIGETNTLIVAGRASPNAAFSWF